MKDAISVADTDSVFEKPTWNGMGPNGLDQSHYIALSALTKLVDIFKERHPTHQQALLAISEQSFPTICQHSTLTRF
jgi:hypothetical protein